MAFILNLNYQGCISLPTAYIKLCSYHTSIDAATGNLTISAIFSQYKDKQTRIDTPNERLPGVMSAENIVITHEDLAAVPIDTPPEKIISAAIYAKAAILPEFTGAQ